MRSLVGGLAGLVGGGGGNSAAREAAALRHRAEQQQEKALKLQEASQARLRQREDERAEELSAQAASLRASVASRRTGRNSLAFRGAQSGLQSTLGA